jgi:hypothetical protein
MAMYQIQTVIHPMIKLLLHIHGLAIIYMELKDVKIMQDSG